MIVDTMSILNKYGAGLVAAIRQSISGRNATGNTSASLRYEIKGDGTKDILRVLGRPYIMALETGRKATPQYTKPSYAFVQSIRDWLKAKGGDQGLAYVIARSIHQKGTKGKPGIISKPVNEYVELIKQDTAKQFAKLYLFNAVEFFKRGNSN